jgi:hypothetical protein
MYLMQFVVHRWPVIDMLIKTQEAYFVLLKIKLKYVSKGDSILHMLWLTNDMLLVYLVLILFCVLLPPSNIDKC